MSLFHYFSANPDKRAKFVFNFIAPFYSKINGSFEEYFKYAVSAYQESVPIKGKTVLDLGTGTGAWAANFRKQGAARVVGIDFSAKMIHKARENYPNGEFLQSDAEDLQHFADNSFDIVTASFVLHGVKQDKRANMLKEMHRISRKHILLYDFMGETPRLLQFVEFMERSDYKHFKVNICSELKDLFSKPEKVHVKYGTGIYFAEK